MNAITTATHESDQLRPALSTTVAGILAVGLGAVLAANDPVLGVLIVAAFVSILLVVRHIELSLPIGMFLMYINSPSIAAANGLPKSLSGLLVVAILALPIVYRVVFRRESIKVDPGVPYIAAFIVVQFLGCVFMAPDPIDAFEQVKTSLTEGLVLFVVVTNAITSKRLLLWSVWALVVAGGIMGGVPLHQYATGNVMNDYGGLASMDQTDLAQAAERGVDLSDKSQYGGRIRLAGVIGEKNRFAQVLVVLTPLCAFLALMHAGWLRWLAVGLGVGIAGGIVVTFSRGAVVGLGGALFLAAVIGIIRWKHFGFALILAVAVVCSSSGFRDRLASLAGYAGIATSAQTMEETSAQGRFNEMATAVKVFTWNPLLGVGPGMFSVYYEKLAGFEEGKQHAGARRSHNLFLNIASEHGLLGMLAFGGFILSLLQRLNHAMQKRHVDDPVLSRLCGAMIVLVLAYLGTGMFLHFAYIRYFWLTMAVAAATATVAGCDVEQRLELGES